MAYQNATNNAITVLTMALVAILAILPVKSYLRHYVAMVLSRPLVMRNVTMEPPMALVAIVVQVCANPLVIHRDVAIASSILFATKHVIMAQPMVAAVIFVPVPAK
jgi:hypothetical protein